MTSNNIIVQPKNDHDSDKVDKKEVIRDVCFTKIDTPFGLESYHFVWIWHTIAHTFAVSYCVLDLSGLNKRNTIPFEIFYGYFGGLGITVGCHRYWSHRSFKANKPLQILLMIMQTVAFQWPIHKWSLEHRIHHKYTDTNADPYSSKRGLLFSHIGWLWMPKHPDFLEKRKYFHMPDLENDPIVRFQSKWYWELVFIFNLALPIAFIYYFYELPLLYAVACNFRRYVASLHFTYLVNSAAHKWGDKPYDKNSSSVNNAVVSLLTVGEGWHNYHHTFPWDYRASEFGWKINISTIFIDFFAWLGWASEMKTVSQKMIRERIRRTGDLIPRDNKSVPQDDRDRDDFAIHTPLEVTEFMKNMEQPLWGWEDEKMTEEFRDFTKVLYPHPAKSI